MEYIIPAIEGIIVAIIAAISAHDVRKRKKLDVKAEQRAADRAEESRLSMSMMSASIDLGVATALAVEGHKINGEMKAAKEKAGAAQKEYYDFINSLAARQIAKS